MSRLILFVSAALLVSCMPPPLQGTRRGELHLAVEGDSGAPALNITFDVGSVPVGSTKQITVRATNVGIDALTVSGASLGSAGNGSWFVRSSGAMLEPGASTTATVTFAPASAGPQSTQVTFSHDADAAFPSAQLSGTGT